MFYYTTGEWTLDMLVWELFAAMDRDAVPIAVITERLDCCLQTALKGLTAAGKPGTGKVPSPTAHKPAIALKNFSMAR